MLPAPRSTTIARSLYQGEIMTRQKRTHLFILALVPVVVFTAVRCADSTVTAPPVATAPTALTPEIQAKVAKLHSETDWIGQFHNDALRFVFTNLQRIPLKARNPRNI